MSGVTGNGAQTGNVDFEVPHDAPRLLYYQCSNHSAMAGELYISDATSSATVNANSGNWDTTYTRVASAHHSWDKTHTSLYANSAGWNVGTSSLVTVGTIGTGTWQGTAVADAYVAGSALWNWVASNSATKYEDTTVFGTLSARDRVIASAGASLSGNVTVGSDLTVGGDLTVTGDDIVMGTNTVGHILMGGGTNFGPVAQTSITSVGTVSAGTWQGTEVGLGYGGTELVGETDGKIVIADGSGAPVHLDVGSSTGITILGTIATGVWQGTAVADA